MGLVIAAVELQAAGFMAEITAIVL